MSHFVQQKHLCKKKGEGGQTYSDLYLLKYLKENVIILNFIRF